MMRTPSAVLVVVAAMISAIVSVGTPRQVYSQRLGISVDMVRGSRESDLGTLRGGRIEHVGRIGDSGFELRKGLMWVGRGGRSFGSTCSGGPYPPGACPPEPIAERRSLVLGAFGIGIASGPRLFGVGLHVDALAGRGSIVDRGIDSGERRSAARVLLGIAGGIEARMHPASSRLQLYAGMESAGITPFVTSCDDCWMPFGGNFGFQRWYGGVAIGRKRVP